LFKHQNNRLFVIEQTTSSAAAKEGGHFLSAAATPPQLPQLRRRAARLTISDNLILPIREIGDRLGQTRNYWREQSDNESVPYLSG
jgi:hypothetical protein